MIGDVAEGTVLQRRRYGLHMTLGDLAEKTGIPIEVIDGYEEGRVSLTDDQKKRIAEVISDRVHKFAEPDQSAKQDAGKPRLSLVPPQILYEIEKVRRYGCGKYPDGGVDNWRLVEPQRYFEAYLRHTVKAWMNGPLARDPESGLMHIAHAACNLAFYFTLMADTSKKEGTTERGD